jgi:subtilisin-like proprotein convertase family protein
MLKNLLLLGACCVFSALPAQSLWQDIPESEVPAHGQRHIVPQRYRTLRLALPAMQALLAQTHKPEGEAGPSPEVVLAIPLPDGGMGRFAVRETPVMAPALQARYPEIRCYTGRGLDDPGATAKFDLTPVGFHAQLRSRGQSPVYIDPYAQGDAAHYIVYHKKDFRKKDHAAHFSCGVEASESADFQENTTPNAAAAETESQGDCVLRRYRLALACTGEYGQFHGGTKPLVLAAMNTSMNRVNGVYEDEIAVTMQLVPNNDTLIFLNGGSDPYSNGNGGTMLGQNQTVCNNRIGVANYDIGHVFGRGSGGIAGLGVVCTSDKARGVTGQNEPIGDPFDIDYVAHEMGHQFGANHTQNNDCNSELVASMEPGSASTIMGYAGICAPNVQSNSDAYFHAISLEEMGEFITTQAGNTCPVKTVTGNGAPTVSAGSDFHIPRNTPFALTAFGSDPDNDPITYCWEQMDPQFATMPPSPNSATGPLFRSFLPSPSPTRTFPRLQDIVNNVTPTWERLPNVARTLNFRVTARDNNALGGCTDEDNLRLTVVGSAGPFQVTEPNTAVTWFVGETKTVTWNVNNTTLAPINCSSVRILLSTDGGFTYPEVLAEQVPNNGSATVLVPEIPSTTCRVRVEAADNVFFDISNQNFRIEIPPVPSFLMSSSTNQALGCVGQPVSFSISLASLAGFADPVSLSVQGIPPGANAQWSSPVVPTPGSATLTISNLSDLAVGNSNLRIIGNSGTLSDTLVVDLNVVPGAPAAAALLSPADGAVVPGSNLPLGWASSAFADGYAIQLATAANFAPAALVLSQSTTGTGINVPALQPATVYYWRVLASNHCGDAPASPIFAFQTQNVLCDNVFNSTDVPKTISSSGTPTAVSVLNVPPGAGTITDLKVNLTANHSFVGDLQARLIGPGGVQALLFDRPGVPLDDFGCDGNNLNLVFDDASPSSAALLEGLCAPTTPTLSGDFQSLTPLATFDGLSADGQWQLSISDAVDQDGGSITAWGLDICFEGSIPPLVLLANNSLPVPQGGEGTLSAAYLEMPGSPAQALFTLRSQPAHGILRLNGLPLGLGGRFTQADVNAGAVRYQHDGSATMSDLFLFDAFDENSRAWLDNQVFNFNILQNNLAVTAVVTQAVRCNNGNDGQISASATGLDGNYTFSLNGGPAQASGLFGNLAPGTYTVTVRGQFGFAASTGPITVANPAAIALSATVNGSNVTATATNGTAPLSYSLNGVDFQPEPLFPAVANGVYALTVLDGQGCSASTQVLVAVDALLAVLEISATPPCAGQAQGSVTVMAAGGTAPLSYSLNGVDFQASPVFTGLPAGVYSAFVRDAGTLSAQTNSVSIGEPAALALGATANLNSLELSASGGTGAYQYSLDGQNFQSGNTFGNLVNGASYTATVQDANGCTAQTTLQILYNSLSIITISTLDVSCADGNDGLLGLCVDGGIGALTASLEPALGNYTPSSGNCALLAAFNGLPPGSYTLTVTDAAGFTATGAASIGNPEPLALSVTNLSDTLVATATGGTFGYEYSLDGLTWQPSPLFPGLPNGAYTVLVRDIKGCTTTANYVLDFVGLQDVALLWQVGLAPNPSGGQVQLTLQNPPQNLLVELFDGTGRGLRRYQFEPGSGSFSTALDLLDLPQGLYFLRLSDGRQQGGLRLQLLR